MLLFFFDVLMFLYINGLLERFFDIVVICMMWFVLVCNLVILIVVLFIKCLNFGVYE